MTRSAVPLAILFAALLIAGLAVSNVAAAPGTGNVNLLVGMKSNDYWAVGSQSSVGVDLTWGGHGWPILLNVYGNGSWGKGQNVFDDDVSEASYETGIGLTKIWNVRAFHPHVGAGIAHAIRKTHIVQAEESGEGTFQIGGTRPWIAVGGFWRFGSGMNFGVAMRRSELRSTYPSLGGTQVGFTLGWGWPAEP